MAVLCNSASTLKQYLRMAKTLFYLRVSTWSKREETYVTEYRDNKLYDIEDKAQRADLARTVLRLLIEGAEVKLYQQVDRASLASSIKDDDLF